MEWIKVAPETMPPENKTVLISVSKFGKKETCCAQMFHGYFLSLETDFGGESCEKWMKEDVTHWMPLPEPAED